MESESNVNTKEEIGAILAKILVHICAHFIKKVYKKDK